MSESHRGPAPAPTVRVAGIDIAAVTLGQAVGIVLALSRGDRPSLVVTPNVDHVVRFERGGEYAAAYESAALRVADGAPIVALARLLGTPLPERVTGIDLTVALLRECERGHRRVAFFGGAPQHLARAVERIRTDYPDLDIVATASPMVNLAEPTEEELGALSDLAVQRPEVLFVFLGSPKQELWFARRANVLPPAAVLAVGGTVDFLAGAKHRAPRWVQQIGCEWIWRLAQEPGRLFERYLVRDSRFIVIAARAYAEHLRVRSGR